MTIIIIVLLIIAWPVLALQSQGSQSESLNLVRVSHRRLDESVLRACGFFVQHARGEKVNINRPIHVFYSSGLCKV